MLTQHDLITAVQGAAGKDLLDLKRRGKRMVVGEIRNPTNPHVPIKLVAMVNGNGDAYVRTDDVACLPEPYSKAKAFLRRIDKILPLSCHGLDRDCLIHVAVGVRARNRKGQIIPMEVLVAAISYVCEVSHKTALFIFRTKLEADGFSAAQIDSMLLALNKISVVNSLWTTGRWNSIPDCHLN